MRKTRHLMALAVTFAAGLAAGQFVHPTTSAQTQTKTRVFELRTYVSPAGRLPDLQTRFRNHTTKLFEKHGMTNVGYWVPQEEPAKSTTIIYVLAHESREAAKKSWDGFRTDPEWVKARAVSEVNGPIVDKVTSVYMDPTDYSTLQ